MARGLSDLQQKILVMAYERKDRPFPHQCDLHAREVLTEVYGFSYKYVRPNYGGQAFSPGEIGEQKYNAARIAVWKSFDRLKRRGLATKSVMGLTLTEEGREKAKAVIG